MKIINSFIFSLLLILLSTACKKDTPAPSQWTNNIEALIIHNDAKITISEGIAGTLTLMEGNCMPVIGPNSTCKEYPVKRRIRIYDYTLMSQTTNDGATVFSQVFTDLKATADCDSEGFYQVKMLPGKYSLFIEEKGKLYANGLDGDGGINSLVVQPDNVSRANLKIIYASF